MNTETETKIPKWLDEHPVMRAYQQEKAAETLQQRREAAQRLEAVKTEIAEGFPEQEAALSSILHDLKEAEKQVTSLKAEAMEAGRTLRIAKADLERKRQAVEVSLYSTYDERIDAAQAFFRNKIDDLRRPGTIDSRPMGSERDLVRMNKVVKMENNHEAVDEAMQFCRGAIEKLESMKLLPEFPAAQVEALKEGIPRIDRYVEYCAERAMPKDAPVTAGAPSDYMLGKLYEKADKALRRRR